MPKKTSMDDNDFNENGNADENSTIIYYICICINLCKISKFL